MSGGSGIQVLYVDNEPDLTEVIAEDLRRYDQRLEIDTAGSVSDGLDRLAQRDYDCVVSDYDMPDQDGVEFLQAVRDEYPDLPFILHTGTGSEDIASQAISSGVTDYLQKQSETDQHELLANSISDGVEYHQTERRIESSHQPVDTPTKGLSLERYEAFIEQSTDIITVLSPDGVYQYQSPSCERILGYEPSELIGEFVFEYIHPEDRDRVVETFNEAISAPEMTPTAEFRFKHKDGTWRWIESIGNNQLNNPAIEGFIVNSRDITQHKEREQELRATRERMEFALEATDTLIWDWNVGTNQATFHPSEESLYGTTVTTREDFLNVIHPKDRQQVRESLAEALETGEPKYEEARIRRNGEVRWIEAPGKPVTEDGTRHMIGVVRDITDRKEQEQTLQRQNERLERFVSVISHDLRNPMSVAQARVELTQEEYDSTHLAKAADALDRMETLIDDLLTLAREGQRVGDTGPVALATISEDCWGNVMTDTASLVIDTEQSIRADSSRLRELLANLIRNAIEHADTDVTVKIGDCEDGFYVADDGPGIPEEGSSEMFETGYSTAEEGTGLGLTIVEDIAEAHGWEIQVTESDADGARFEITQVDIIDK